MPLEKIAALVIIPLLFLNLAFNLVPLENHFAQLSQAITHGQLHTLNEPQFKIDFALYNGKYYSPFGPFPAIILIPFQLVPIDNHHIFESLIKFPLTLINLLLVYQIAKLQKLDHTKSLLIATFYIFGSSYTPTSLLSASAYLTSIITTTLLLSSIYIFLSKKNYAVIGALLALSILTRPATGLATIFFAYFTHKSGKTDLVKLFMPILIAAIIFTSYNYLRFGNFAETGYKYQIVPPILQATHQNLFSPKNIPANLHFIFAKTPEINYYNHALAFPYLKFNPFGMSIFIISPILFLIFSKKALNEIEKISLVTILFLLVPIITYYGIGYRQVGSKYSLDFLPFLLLILANRIKDKNSFLLLVLVISSVLITWFFSFQLLGVLHIST